MSMLIVGDLILDRYWFGTSSRLSPEAPVPVVDEIREEWRLGGAANVARQLRALGEDVVIAGTVGDDAAGERLRAMLAEEGVRTVLVTEPGRPTTLKHRIVANDHQIARVDAESRHELTEEQAGTLLRRLAEVLPYTDAVVLSDYSKGVLTSLVTRGVIDALGGAAPVVVDTKAMCLLRYARATVLTPNEMELRRATGHTDLDEAAGAALARLDGGAVLVTQGARGMTLWRPDARAGAPARHRTARRGRDRCRRHGDRRAGLGAPPGYGAGTGRGARERRGGRHRRRDGQRPDQPGRAGPAGSAHSRAAPPVARGSPAGRRPGRRQR